MGSGAERTTGKMEERVARWGLADWDIPHLHVDKPGGTNGE